MNDTFFRCGLYFRLRQNLVPTQPRSQGSYNIVKGVQFATSSEFTASFPRSLIFPPSSSLHHTHTPPPPPPHTHTHTHTPGVREDERPWERGWFQQQFIFKSLQIEHLLQYCLLIHAFLATGVQSSASQANGK